MQMGSAGDSGGGGATAGDSTDSSSSSMAADSTMSMFFFNATPFTLLFEAWVPRTPGQLVGAFFAIFFLALAWEAFQVLSVRMEAHWSRLSRSSSCGSSTRQASEAGGYGGPAAGPPQHEAFPWTERCLFLPYTYAELARTVLRFISLCFQYLLMLAIMSFNATIFFAAVTGLALGELFFRRYKKPAASALLAAPWACVHLARRVPLLAAVGLREGWGARAAVWILRALEVAAGVLVLVFALKDHGGVPSLSRGTDINVWNYHAVLMVFFVVAMSEAFITYHFPLLGACTCENQCSTVLTVGTCHGGTASGACSCHRRRTRKAVHLTLQTGAVVMAFIALAAIVYYKEIPDPDVYSVEFVQVYTVHAFIGTLTLFFMALQYLVGVGAVALLALLPGALTPPQRQWLATAQAFVSKAAFIGGTVSCVVGLMDQQMMEVDTWTDNNTPSTDGDSAPTADYPAPPDAPLDQPPAPAADPGYGFRSAASLEASFLGAVLLGVTLAHLLLDGVQTARLMKARAADAEAAGTPDPQQEHDDDGLPMDKQPAPACCGKGGAAPSKTAPSDLPAMAAAAVSDHSGSTRPDDTVKRAGEHSSDGSARKEERWFAAERQILRLAWRASWSPVVVRAFEATALILVAIFTVAENGGFPAFSSHDAFTMVNYHVLLMVLAFAVAMSEAILAYRAPLFGRCACRGECGRLQGCPCGAPGACTCTGQHVRKGLHIALQTAVVVMAYVGLAAVLYFKQAPLDDEGLPPLSGTTQMYSVHSFVGAITLLLMTGQYLVGLSAHLVLRDRMTDQRRAAMAGWHAFFGKATFTSGLIACMSGAMDIQMMEVDNGVFEQRSRASKLLSFLGVVLFGLLLSHFFLDHVAGVRQVVSDGRTWAVDVPSASKQGGVVVLSVNQGAQEEGPASSAETDGTVPEEQRPCVC